MSQKSRHLSGGPNLRLVILALSILVLGLAGCSEDLTTQAPPGGNDPATGVFRVDMGSDDVDFEIISLKNGDPENPIDGPFAIIGRNIHYDTELAALVVDLSVKNLGENTFDEAVMLTFLSLFPDSVTVLNPDNEENGAGAAIEFEFENADGQWTPGEESLLRETHFGVDQGISIGFTARLDTGIGAGLGSIGGMVWNDENGDGIMDESEAGVEGAMLELSAENMEAMTTLSMEDGTYRFDGLESGFYQVVRKPLDGMVGTTSDMIYVILVHEDGTVSSFMAANYGVKADEGGGTAVIKGQVWNDLNGDGNVNDGEPGLEGLTVTLSGDSEATATTAEDGGYIFAELSAGTYEVVSTGPEGWVLTTDSPIVVVLETDDATFNDGSFGWMEGSGGDGGAIGGIVFNDLNGNRVQDDGEPGLEGITVDLSGDATVTMVSSADGAYVFTDLAIGDYEVTSTGPDGWSPTTGPILNVRLETDDEVVDDANFGWMDGGGGEGGAIGGIVFNDMNGNRVQDDGEPGLEGITVDLSGDATATVVSSADGAYVFTGLVIGDYEVTSTGPDGWSPTTGPILTVKLEVVDEVVDDAHFGWMQP